MAVRDALQKAAIRLVGQRPTTFFGASGQTELELTDLVNEVAEDIAQYHDWQALVRLASINGDGSEEYPFPDDYDRMMLDSDVQDPNAWFWGYFRYDDLNAFVRDKSFGPMPTPGGWIIYGGNIHFYPAPTQAATFPYISKNIVLDTSTAPKEQFEADTDTFRLPERLLTLGLVWRWRENKKLDAAGDQEAFIKALDEYAAKDGGSKVQRYGSSGRRLAVGRAYSGGAW